MSDPGRTATVHGTGLVIDETGILVRGPSGSGKTSLALALIARARAEGRFARLVADDRVALQPRHGRIVMRAPASISGLAEVRGAGLAKIPVAESCLLRMVVDIDPDAARYPEPETRVIVMHATSVPRVIAQFEMGVAAVMLALSGGFDDTAVTE